MEKIKQSIKKYFFVITTILLLILSMSLFSEKQDLKWNRFYSVTAIPDVELVNHLSFNSKNIASGSLTGFVSFDNIGKQPRDLRQYIEISASDSFDKEGNQRFYTRDIIKMNYLAPKYFDYVVLTIKNISGDIITLADTANNLYFINKKTREVSMFDATKDAISLIMSDLDFKDFMKELLL